jgi:carbon monoxide dehydrogenase subunit G
MADYLGNTDLRTTAAAELKEERVGLPKWSQIMRDVGSFVETNYRQMSQVTHVTGSTVAAFVERKGDRYEFQGSPEDPHSEVNLFVTANAVMLAAWLIGQLVDTPDIRKELDEVAARLGLAQTIQEDG